MTFVADLHIHSRFSRATSRSLNLESLDHYAGRKGIAVVGSGDLTHPAWLAEIEERLEEAEEGLFRLKPGFRQHGSGETRFLLSGEISSIYKKDGRVRKVHSLILMPDLESAKKFSAKLDAIGNIRSDGRPILGLDAKDLLAICLDTSPESFFIPAHIWTPWFSLLGSKSGFDAVEECFGDLSPHIHALETGLSSDPPMNWRLSALDRYVLVSNSDAHSADKLGREANLFGCAMSYPAMVGAMRKQGGFEGTIEFFPEEGKYHLDGHRKCNVRLTPEETRKHGGRCPVCGQPVTVGVYSRVVDLADRPEAYRPEAAAAFYSLVPLNEVLGEIIGAGPKTKKVVEAMDSLLRKIGPELYLLREAPVADIEQAGGALVAEAVRRMREGRVHAEGGYDGEYGRIRLFEAGELDRLRGQDALFKTFPQPVKRKKKAPEKPDAALVSDPAPRPEVFVPLLIENDPLLDDLNDEQRSAVTFGRGPLSIIAGPGTGKTTVLTRRAAWLVREGLAEPERILGLTFTRQAASEMASRVVSDLPFRTGMDRLNIMTFHALGLRILSSFMGGEPLILDEDQRLEMAGKAAAGSPFKAAELATLISLAKQKLQGPQDMADPDAAAAYSRYEASLAVLRAVDFDGLVARSAVLLKNDPAALKMWQDRFGWFLIDEYQDVNFAQYELIRLLAPGGSPDLTVIGDPDQAIYGFRGADAGYFMRFKTDYPLAGSVNLVRNYRSTEAILKASSGVISRNPGDWRRPLTAGVNGPVRIATATLPTPAAEAEYVVWRIEQMLGGTSHFALDSGRADASHNGDLSLKDVAVLFRLHALAGPVAEALDKAGLPYQKAGDQHARETDGLDFNAEKISLLSMHAAKGLEFELVFLIGLEDGILPYRPPNKPPADIGEERRLFYVGMTRAKKHLHLTRSLGRTLFGKTSRPAPSPFLEEISRNLLALDKLPDKKPRSRVVQLDLFS